MSSSGFLFMFEAIAIAIIIFVIVLLVSKKGISYLKNKEFLGINIVTFIVFYISTTFLYPGIRLLIVSLSASFNFGLGPIILACLLIGISLTICGIGIFNLRYWARIPVLILTLIYGLMPLLAIISAIKSYAVFPLQFFAEFIIFHVLPLVIVFYYLNQKSVKEKFVKVKSV